jgi:hypothetical protein
LIWNVRDLAPIFRIDHGERAIAISNDYPIGGSIEPNVICVIV